MLVLACGGVLIAEAGIRGPGKYCGVVVFDRWGTGFLLSGHFLTYISETVKGGLRPYKGKAMQVDALDIFQAQNPGSGLVRRYKLLGPAPDNLRSRTLDGAALTAGSDFGFRSPTFLLGIRNSGKALWTSGMALTAFRLSLSRQYRSMEFSLYS